MFGQGMSVSLLQNTSMVATLGNGGVRMDPHIVDGLTDGDGVFAPTEVGEGTRVVSEETAGKVVAMMESVTADGGTGVLGRVEGYRVAAKTGTAQIADGQGGLSSRLGSYVGLAPAEDPRLAVGVVDLQAAGDVLRRRHRRPGLPRRHGLRPAPDGRAAVDDARPDLPREAG